MEALLVVKPQILTQLVAKVSIPATTVLTLITRDSKICWRLKASSWRVNVAAR